MKALIATTCIAILAGVGFYFYQSYQASVAAESAARFDPLFHDVCADWPNLPECRKRAMK